MTNKTTFTGEVNIPSNSSYKIGGSAAPFMRVVTSTAVNTGNPGSTPTITAGGNASAGSITFAIPRGNAGQNGTNGPPGAPGPQGGQGAQGNRGAQGNQGATGGSGGSGGNIGTTKNGNINTNAYFRSNGYAYIDGSRSHMFYAQYNRSGLGYPGGSFQGYHGDDHFVQSIGYWNMPIGCYTNHYFRSGGLTVKSDGRQKKEVTTLDTETCLNKIKKIRPVSYLDRSTERFSLGFVAQELKKEINIAVDPRGNDFVENLQLGGKFSNKRGPVNPDVDKKQEGPWYLYTFTLAEGVEWPDVNPLVLRDKSDDTWQVEQIKFMCPDNKEFQSIKNFSVAVHDSRYCDQPKERSVDLLIPVKTDEYSGTTEDPRIDIDEDELYFLEGTRVDDYHSINYNEVFTALTGAVQELDKKRVSNQKRIDALESKV